MPRSWSKNHQPHNAARHVPTWVHDLYGLKKEKWGKKKSANELRISTISTFFCRGDRIRTCGRLVPNQERYRAALHPECCLRLQRYKKVESWEASNGCFFSELNKFNNTPMYQALQSHTSHRVLQKQCSCSSKALLLDAQSIALGRSEH